MNSPLFEYSSPREFKLWRYTVSHGQLLLRSSKRDEASMRLEVLFKGVHWIQLPTFFDGLAIGECNIESIPAREDLDLGPALSWHRCFRVSSRTTNGYVIASSVFVSEDDGDDCAPSSLFVDGIR